jgi:hypothetical protein
MKMPKEINSCTSFAFLILNRLHVRETLEECGPVFEQFRLLGIYLNDATVAPQFLLSRGS